jgi:general secretion pathway protein A
MTTENAFSISPNPRYFYITPAIAAALDKTRYVIQARQGLTTIIGDVGLGKTSLLRLLFNEYADNPAYTTALMINPNQTSETAFLKAVCHEFEVPTRRSQRETEYELRSFLIEETKAGRNVVLFVDEAQQLRGPMFEQIRQILNFETDDLKLINIVLAGQIELRHKLADRSKRALVSRIAVSSSLDALTLEETRAMIGFRCHIAGLANPFTAAATEAVFRWSKGVPREAIKLCALGWQYAQANQSAEVTPAMLEAAQTDVAGATREKATTTGTHKAARKALR